MGDLRNYVLNYRAVVKDNPETLKELPKNTRDRYRNAEFPLAVLWLLRHPELLRALADDAMHGRIPPEVLTKYPKNGEQNTPDQS